MKGLPLVFVCLVGSCFGRSRSLIMRFWELGIWMWRRASLLLEPSLPRAHRLSSIKTDTLQLSRVEQLALRALRSLLSGENAISLALSLQRYRVASIPRIRFGQSLVSKRATR